MRFGVLAAAAACVMAVPASAATTVGLGDATSVAYKFVFEQPVTGYIDIMVWSARLYPAGDGFEVAEDLYDRVEFNNSRFGLAKLTSRKLGGSGYVAYQSLTYDPMVSPGLTPQFSFTASFGVPEPATWALMILGFGAVAGAMRRRPHRYATTS